MKKLIFASIPFFYLLLTLLQIDLAMLADLGRHIKLGEVVLHCFCVPQTNLFSYTHPHFPIINHEWFGEVIFYLITIAFGLNGLIVFKMIVILTAASILYYIALKKGSLFWVTLVSLVCITLFSMRFSVLPEMFSYLFISVFILILEKYKQTKKFYLLFFLPFIEFLWVNTHIYFILGITIYGFFFLEQLIKHKHFDKKLVMIGVLLIAATLVNPNFIQGALLPFTFSTNYGFNVEENNSPLKILEPTSTNSNIAYTLVLQVVTFEIVLGLFLLTLFIKKQWTEIFHTGNGITAAFLGLKFTRCISLFGLLGFIPLVQALTSIEEKLKKSIEVEILHIVKGVFVLCVAIVVGIHIHGLFEYKILHFGFMPSAEKAAEFIKQANVKGRIFNNYIIGNYLIYALYPQEQVYVDGRPEAYPATFFDDYWKMMADEQFFNNQVKKYNINAVVFNVAIEDPMKSRPFLTRLLDSKDWVPVYADGIVTIFARNNEVNKHVIEKYRINVQRN